MIRKTLCQIAQATCLATLALSVTMAADQGEPPTVARPANDWATVFITRFDESPLKLENKGAGPMYLERPGTPEVTAALVDGRFAKAINFAATPTILVRLPMVDHPVDQLSVECWLNANASDSITPETIYECRGMHRLKLLREGGAKLVWEARINGVWEALSCPIPLQQWHHAALTYDGHMVKLFLNDKVVAEKARAGRIVRLNTYHRAITLGSDCDTAGRFNGSLDEFRLSRVARSSFLDGKSIVAPLPTTKAVIAKAPPKEIRPDRPYHLHSTLRVPFVSTPPVIDGAMDDSGWASVPDEHFLETGIGFDWGRNWATFQSVIMRMARDQDNLYVICRVLEQTPKGLVGDNPEFWKTNCVELYLQPGGYGTPYIQIAANAYGKNWSMLWTPKPGADSSPHARDQKPLSLTGMRQAAVVNGDTWTVELAIPFKDLGAAAPQPGTVWRGNVAYTGKNPEQNNSWGYVWPLFYWQNMFPQIEFTDGKTDSTRGGHILRGSFVDASGKPVAWGTGKLGALDINGRPVLTNSVGEFTITDLPAGKVTFRTLLPQYDRLDVTVDVQRPVEVIAPIVMAASGVYASSLPLDAKAGNASLFESSVELPPDLPVKADTLKPLTGLNFLAAAGEFESRAFCVLANAAVDSPRLALDPVFTSGGKKELRLERAEPRWTQRVLVRDEDNVSPEECGYVWRFMRLENPDELHAGDLRHVVLVIKLPDNAAAGTYTSTLHLLSGETEFAAIPVTLTVPSFHLAEPEKQVGFYHYQRVKAAAGGAILPDDALRRDYRAMRELGATQAVVCDLHINPNAPDPWAEVHAGVRLQKEAGLGPLYFTWIHHTWAGWLTSEKDAERARFKELIDGLAKVEDELGLPRNSIAVAFSDEVQRWEQSALNWIVWAKRFKELTPRPVYSTVYLKEGGKEKAVFEDIMQLTDIACFNGTPGDWDAHRAVLDKNHGVGWFYPNSIKNTLYTREANGYYLWGSPFQAAIPWTFYYSPSGDYFDNLDGDTTVFCYMAPHPDKPGEMIPALLGEAYREGHDDLRYLATLDAAITKAVAAKGETETVKVARALLAAYTGKSGIPRTYGSPVTTQPEDFLARRAAIVQADERLSRE